MYAEDEDPLPAGIPRNARFGGGCSTETLTVSFVAHVLLFFVAIFLTPPRPAKHLESMVIDLGSLQAPTAAPGPPGTPTGPPQARSEAPPTTAAEPAEAPAAQAAPPVEIPARPEVAAEPPPEAKPLPEAAPEPNEAKGEAVRAEQTSPGQPEAAPLMDPMQWYEAAVGQRVLDVTATLRVRPLFRGTMVVHLRLDPIGNLVGQPTICPEHTEVYPTMNFPPAMLDRHYAVLQREVLVAMIEAAPYPNLPPGLLPPEVLTYSLPINGEWPPPQADNSPALLER